MDRSEAIVICKRGSLWYPNHDTHFDAARCVLRCRNCGQCFSSSCDALPFYARPVVRDRGGDPDTITLDEAIALLKGRFPCGIVEYRGTPLRDVPLEAWRAVWLEYQGGDKWITAYSADFRYMRAIAAREKWSEFKNELI